MRMFSGLSAGYHAGWEGCCLRPSIADYAGFWQQPASARAGVVGVVGDGPRLAPSGDIQAFDLAGGGRPKGSNVPLGKR